MRGTSLHSASFLFLGGFSEKVELLRVSDGTETLSLRIQLDYSGQTMKINQKYFSFLVKEHHASRDLQ